MSRKKILLTLLIGAIAGPLGALEPPTRAEIDHYLKDGSYVLRLLRARALGNHLVDPLLLRALSGRLTGVSTPGTAAKGAEPMGTLTLPSGRRGLPTKGNVKVFALLIDFPDYPAVNGRDDIDSKLFGDGDGGWPYESLRNYYRRSSYGLLEIGGTTMGWYRPAYGRSGMPQTEAAREGLIMEALNYFHARGQNFAQYDNNGDGIIDYFIVVWTGPNNGWANFWWGYQTTFSNANFSLDGKRLRGTKYSWQWESRFWPGPYDQIVVMHETGHALGLPDYYDYDAAVGPPGGLGGLDMMDATRGDHNCFSKMLLDWITPQVFNSGTRAFALGQSALTQDALIVMPEFDPAGPFGEFFMVQNRTRAANDFFFPGDGLLIWHVDARLNSQQTNFLYDNSYTAHKLLRLMEADGLEHIEHGYSADAGDYYVPGRVFGSETVPDSRRYDGSASGVGVGDISAPGPSMAFTADIHYTLLPPLETALTRKVNDLIFFHEYINRLTWAANGGNHTAITAYRILAKPLGAGDGSFVPIADVDPGAGLVFEHRGLKKDELYAYRILAVDKNGVVSLPAEVSN